MKIALLQMDILLGEVEKNQAKVEAMTGQAMQNLPDVIVLPEMWNAGFFPDGIQRYADKNGEQTQALLGNLAKKFAVNIIGGSAATLHEGRVYNTNYVFNRRGDLISTYQKIHLFSPSGENKVFQAGRKISVFSVDGIKAAVVICYDIRFCELIRLLALEGISVLFVPAAWPEPRLAHWDILLKARAIENQLFVVGVNGVGRANELKFCGHSMVINPWGEVLASGQATEAIVSATADLSLVDAIKSKMDVFGDRADLYSLTCKRADRSFDER